MVDNAGSEVAISASEGSSHSEVTSTSVRGKLPYMTTWLTFPPFPPFEKYIYTEWAGCQRVGISPDTHRVPCHISFGSRGSAGRQRLVILGLDCCT